jgi:preprotein translocase subunit SecG
MQTVLLVIYLMVVVALIGIVLIQRSEGGGLGIGGGSGFMSARGAANALTRTTAILATLFFALALGMGILARYESKPTDILDRIPGTTGDGNGVLNSLGGEAAPSTSQPAPAPAPANNNAVPTEGGAATGGSTAAPAGQPATSGQNTDVPTGQ